MIKKSLKRTTRQKKCKICGGEYLPRSTLQTACSIICAQALVEIAKLKERKSWARKEKKKLRENDRGWWLKATEEACNTYIKLRDWKEPCISCGKYYSPEDPWVRANKIRQAGHFLSVGAHPELRFHWMNINLQCNRCNCHQGGAQAAYRVNLVDKIGLPAVEWLEGPHKSQHLTIEDLKEIRDYFREQTKLLTP